MEHYVLEQWREFRGLVAEPSPITRTDSQACASYANLCGVVDTRKLEEAIREAKQQGQTKRINVLAALNEPPAETEAKYPKHIIFSLEIGQHTRFDRRCKLVDTVNIEVRPGLPYRNFTVRVFKEEFNKLRFDLYYSSGIIPESMPLRY